MELAAWIIAAASLSFAAGVAVSSYAFSRMTVPKSAHDAALRAIAAQRATIDRLLLRRLEGAADAESERLSDQFGKLVRRKPANKAN